MVKDGTVASLRFDTIFQDYSVKVVASGLGRKEVNEALSASSAAPVYGILINGLDTEIVEIVSVASSPWTCDIKKVRRKLSRVTKRSTLHFHNSYSH